MKKRIRSRTKAILPTRDDALEEQDDSVDSTDSPVMERQDSMISRIGGFDGIMSMMGKVQKVFGFFQQMRPAFSMVGSFLGTKAFVSSVPVKRAKLKNSKTRKHVRTAASTASRGKTKRKPASRR